MKTLDHYLDRAREVSGFPSDRALARALPAQAATVNHWRTKRSLPSDELMCKLARFGGEDETAALVHLNCWRATGHAAELYIELAKRVSAAAIIAGLSFGIFAPSPAEASTRISERPVSAQTVYIMENMMGSIP
ncbi:MAG: hypothetical protein RLW87_07950 [Alphaproteobacteria bacterium]